jgi:hypothetical protein
MGWSVCERECVLLGWGGSVCLCVEEMLRCGLRLGVMLRALEEDCCD